MDTCRDTDNSVVAGIGEQLHDGRVHPYFAGDSNCSSVDTSHSGEKSHLVEEGVKQGRRSCAGSFLQPSLLLFAGAAG